MKRFFTTAYILRFIIAAALLYTSSAATAQLGIYEFTGSLLACPNTNNNVTTQPANATFSAYTTVNTSCVSSLTDFNNTNWNTGGTINVSEYNQFAITPNTGYALTLTSVSFTHVTDRTATSWTLRSSLDNFTSNIATGAVSTTPQTPVVNLPSNFTNIGVVTFRLYLTGAQGNTTAWSNDNVTVYGSVFPVPNDPGSPSSNSPQCSNTGVTLFANGSPPSGVTWYWQSTATGTSTANPSSSNTVFSSGTYYIRAQDNTTLAWSINSGSADVVITPDVGVPVFSLGSASTRCQASGSVTYTATATNNTGITYSLDNASITGGNTINSATGAVTYTAGWSGTSVITATATGCNGPSTSTHTVTITPVVTVPVFNSGSTSIRCQGAGTVTYTATASNTTGITYALDATSLANGNSINAATGVVTYVSGWSGTSVVTATAAGCTSQSANHTVTITATVGTPVFNLGSTSTRCQAAETINYTATATTNTGITYSLDATSLAGNNSINSSTGDVTYDAGWTGTSVITATATGCNGPKTATHTVTTNGPVTIPVFSLGATSTRCQGSGNVTYTATANYTTGITYTLDAASITGGNTINSATGKVTYSPGWTGTSVITASAAGCSGPQTSTHTVTITPTVGTPVFALGSSSTICQASGTVNYGATATSTTGITYSLDNASITGGNTINSSTGDVTYAAGWSGNTTITASAAGCSGPKTATHHVTITATVGVPVFSLGSASTRCQAPGTVTYTATAANNTGLTYSLDNASVTAGNTINSATGLVTYVSGWSGTSVITATATGCNGPATATHTVTITPVVAVPVFNLGSTSTRCQGAGTVTYTATANNTTGITYTLDATSRANGNTINAATGAVTYAAGWSGTSVITATAAGCTPQSANHTVTITATVGTPVFSLGSTSTRCQAPGTVTYTATATTNTGITYSLDATSLAGNNTIDPATGIVTYDANWNGITVITATATGCNGPKSATHTVTVNGLVSAPVFNLGGTSTRCQGSGNVTYTAAASYTTGITYSLDAASITGGNTINSATSVVTYTAGWTGTSVITASAAGCSGPQTSTHTVTITPTVGTPVFVLGSSSTRCQGSGTINYGATSTNTTGITYSLDNGSVTGGNTINSSTGDVTYAAGWSGTTTITATAAGCSGPKAATHTVTVTATVGVPVFNLESSSVRSQASGTVSYAATAGATTGITYSLDNASVTAGNTINSATGSVTYVAGWSGTSVITATATGCSGPTSSTHTATTNSTSVIKQLYLSNPGQTLTRIDPVGTGSSTTTSTANINNNTTVTFTQSPALFSPLIIKAGTITVKAYLSAVGGPITATPSINAQISYGSNNIITLTNPMYNSGSNILTWTGTLNADSTIPAGQSITLSITNLTSGVNFKIDYGSQAKPSQVDLPVSTFINISSFNVYNAPYPGGRSIISAVGNSSMYARATVTDPFGAADITGMSVSVNPGIISGNATSVAASGNTKTFEYLWTTPASPGNLSVLGTAKEGYENTVTNSQNIQLTVCSTCPPVALDDSASGAGGAPILFDVLSNDYDPNNNINANSLSVVSKPRNGDAVLSNGKIVYIPNGSYSGKDTFSYQICDLTSPTPLCATANVYVNIDPTIVDPCSEATRSQVYYIPYPEQDARTALLASQNTGLTITNIRDIISLKMPYPNMVIVWDQWEDGYETDILNPAQSTTQVWGDGNPYNGIAPGYPNDIIPAGGSIILDNTMPANPRDSSAIFYDGRDKIYASGQISVVQVLGEPSVIGLQCMKTNVTSTEDYGKSFTIPVGTNFQSQDFAYTALFIRASQNNTIVNIDKDNDGSYELTDTLNEGQSLFVNGGVNTGANITSNAPIGVDLHFAGIDGYSSREVPIFPSSWYSNTYYSPVPTTGASTAIKDTNAVYLYNNLNRAITINWSSGIPSSGSIVLPAKTTKRFTLALSQTAAYKFVNPTGESFSAIQVCDSYTPGGGGNPGSTYDWAFNLISEDRLTPFSTLAWAPGSIDGTRDDNPIWVTPVSNTTIYVKYNGDLTSGGSVSPCGLHYDISYPLNTLTHKRLLDLSDNDQGGLAVYTCDGTKIAAVYGEDPSTASTGNPSWDVGSTMRPFCSLKLIFANDDYAFTVTDNPVTIPILKNDVGFTAIIDPASVITAGLLQPKNGTVTINPNGTLLYTPNPGYQGKDTLEYSVCSTPSPVVCDKATVYITINSCPPPASRNILYGKVFLDKTKDGIKHSDDPGFTSGKVYLYTDANCNGAIDANELTDSATVDTSGTYQFVTYPEKVVADDFDGPNGSSSCSTGSDGNATWAGNWVDAGDPSTGFCVTPASSLANTDAEIVKDAGFSYALRLKDNNVSATRAINLSGASYAFLSFSYRRAGTPLANHDLLVQVSTNGSAFTTVYTIKGDGTKDNAYMNVYNQDISSYATTTTVIRFLTNNNMTDADTVYIDNISVKYLKYPQCYIVKVLQSTLPSGYFLTTPTQNTVTFASSGSCTTPADFGVASFSTLPIDMLTFTGQKLKDANLLTWKTSQEINSDRFEVETKTDATDFVKIGSVKAKGNSSVQSSYSFTHNYPPAGVNYYRLKIIDNGGQFKYSDVIALKTDGNIVSVDHIYPNPFTDRISASVALSDPQVLNISLYDANGRVIRSQEMQAVRGLNIITLDKLANLASGIYFIEIKDTKDVLKTKLFKVN